LIVAPDDAEIGLEFIQLAARPAKAFDHFKTMSIGMRLTLVGSPLPAHRLRPIIHGTQTLWQGRVGQAYLNAPA
jgi:hypothetical protein